MARQPWYKRLPWWTRLILIIIAILPLAFGVALISFGSQSTSNDITFAILTGVSILITLIAWLFPFSPKQSKAPPLPLVRELVRESLGMGDNEAANFDYITAPIQDAYSVATQVLLDVSTGTGYKRGIFVRGEANAGKTRLAFEALKQTLPNWSILRWKPHYIIDKVPNEEFLNRQNLVILIDDLQDYLLLHLEDSNRYVLGTYDKGVATLRTLVETLLQAGRSVIFVVTYRTDYETQIQITFDWLLAQLAEVSLPIFNRDPQDPRVAEVITEFEKHGSIHAEDWDGTLGSLVLGLSKKKKQYFALPVGAVVILKAMKLLLLAYTMTHTEALLRAVCLNVFQGKDFLEDELKWQSSIDRLIQQQFVSEVLEENSREAILVIRKEAYFDQVIVDYPIPTRPHQHERYLLRLQEVFMALKDADGLINLGRALADLERYEEALFAIEQAIHLDLTKASALILKGVVLTDLKRYEEALFAIEQAIHLDPTKAAAFVLKGATLFAFEREEEALASFEEAIRLNPDFVDAYYNMGTALIALERNEEALAVFEQAIRLDPDFAPAYYNKGVVLAAHERYEEALGAFEQVVRLAPNKASAYSNKGAVLVSLKRYEEALFAFEQAIRLDPGEVQAYGRKGVALIALERKEEALASFERAIHLDSKETAAYYSQGLTLTNLGRYEEALAAFEQAIRLDPDFAFAYHQKGVALAKLGRYEEALAAFEQAIRLDPDFVDAFQNKGATLANLERYEEALVAFEQAIRLDPNKAAAYYNKALALDASERKEEALASFEQAIRLDPDFAPAYYNKGVVLAAHERYEEALGAFEETIRLDPTKVAAYIRKGKALTALKRYEGALVTFEEAIRFNPKEGGSQVIQNCNFGV